MHGPETLIPLFAIFFLFGGPVIAFIITRVLAHQERIAMIQRGIVPPPRGFRGRGAYRQWAQNQPPGQPWNAAPPPPYVAQPCDDDDPQQALYKGIRLALIGLAIFIGLSFIGGTPGSPDFRGGPWLLGGLIPMFVGIAQIIVALLSGAQLPNGARATFIPPPPPNPGTPPPPPPPYGAWEQPGRPSRFEELSKPAPPPDAR